MKLLWRIARGTMAVTAIVAIVVQAKTLADAGRLDVVNFFSYFTIQSNLIAIGVLLIVAFQPGRARSAALEGLRGATTVYLTVTFVVVVALLQNVDVGLQLAWVDFVLHKLVPIVIVADWLIDPPIVPISWRRSLTWLAYPLVWLAYTSVRGAIVGWYPYPFLDPAHGGYEQVGQTVAIVLPASAVLCLFVALLGTMLGARRRRLESL